MKRLFIRFRNLFCYCGLSKREYNAVKLDAYASNFQVWKHLHVLLMVGYMILMTCFTSSDGVTVVTVIQTIMMLYFAAASALFYFVLKEESMLAQFFIYFTMILLLAAALLINVFQPDASGVTFIVLLVMLPMFMIDKPYFMAILLASAVTVYLIAVYPVKSPTDFRHETLYTCFYGVFGIIINTFYNFIRVKEFTYRRREREYILEEKKSTEEAGRLNSALKKMSESALELLGDVVEERDSESGEHIQRVKGYSYILATQVMNDLPEYKLDKYTVDLITFTSPLHDVGKISITDTILCKPGKLTREEFEIMKTHCEKGCAILEKMEDKWSSDYLNMALDICMSHHEKWDGKGYPQGLKGDEIPIAAQIVSIADIYDALTSKRVYKDAYSYELAYDMIMNGDCGAFSDRLMSCFAKCHDQFVAYAEDPERLYLDEREYELISRANPDESFVIGLHNEDKTLRDKLQLDEELSVLTSLSEDFCYVCYVDMDSNEVIRFKADEQFTRILNSFSSDLRSNERFDKLLNTIIVAEDYAEFREATDRDSSVKMLREVGRMSTDFRIRLDDGVHHCRMRLSIDRKHPNSVVIGICIRDREYKQEAEFLRIRSELEVARREMENQEMLAERLAVINGISSEYDYVCALNAETMEVTVYRAEAWIRDMFKNLEDLVVSPEARDAALRGIIPETDYEYFREASMHANVMQELTRCGEYTVSYRAYKYGLLVNYQTCYKLDKKNPKRIIIGLRCVGPADPETSYI